MGNEADERESLNAHREEVSKLPQRRRDTSDQDRINHQTSVNVRRGITDEAKNIPCKDCGVKYPPYVMDFDHVQGMKVADISDMIQKHIPIPTLVDEISKCEVVCANCHRERTHYRQELDNSEYIPYNDLIGGGANRGGRGITI